MWKIKNIVSKGDYNYYKEFLILHRETHRVEMAVSENVLQIYKDYPEVTADNRNRRDYTPST